MYSIRYHTNVSSTNRITKEFVIAPCFVSDRKRRVLVEGMLFNIVDVNSRVPLGTVIGPLLFFANINDLPDVVTLNVKLFADDCLI